MRGRLALSGETEIPPKAIPSRPVVLERRQAKYAHCIFLVDKKYFWMWKALGSFDSKARDMEGLLLETDVGVQATVFGDVGLDLADDLLGMLLGDAIRLGHVAILHCLNHLFVFIEIELRQFVVE